MKQIYFSAIALCLLMTPSASAWCLFPYYPTYGAGYGGWGAGYAYAPRAYNNYRYAGYGYRGYSYAGYGGFSSACGTCGTAASCSSCNSGCSTCTTTAGYGGCGISNCCTNSCFTDACGGTSTSGKPATDANTDDSDRTFAPAGNDATDSTYDDAPPVEDAAPSGDFSAPSTSSGIDWTKPRNPTTTEPAGDGSPTSPAPFGTNDGLGTEDSGLIAPKEFDPLNRDTNKPPISNPIDEEATDESSEEAPAAEQGSTGSLGGEVDIKDFLSPEASVDRASASRSFRSSHADVISMPRLAGDSRVVRDSRTLVSSSRNEQRPARWISVPLPNGRIRL
jgi:hypothetical protein